MPDRFAIPDPRPLALTVRDRAPLTPLLARITLGGDDLVGFEHAPGQDVMVAVPSGDATINRRYTIRRATRTSARSISTSWSTATARAPAGRATSRSAHRSPRWGRAARSCRSATSTGTCSCATSRGGPPPRRWSPRSTRASSRWWSPRPPGLRSTRSSPGRPKSCWSAATAVARRPATPAALTAAVAALELPAGRGHAYLSAEFAVVRALGADLAARGVGGDQVSPKAYWRRGESNAAHGEPRRES